MRGNLRQGLRWADRRVPWLGRTARRAYTRIWLGREMASGRYQPAPRFVSHFPDYERSTADRRIPAIWHVTWKSLPLPDDFTTNWDRIRVLHPGPRWAHRVWTDGEIIDFVHTHFPGRQRAFEALPKPIMRVDLFRYMLMHVHGGVYSDLDVWMLRPLDDLINDCTLLLAAETDRLNDANFIAQHFLASAPGHPFWEHLLHAALDQPLDVIRGYGDPVSFTGPIFVTRIWRQTAAGVGAKVAPRVNLCPPAMLRRQGFALPAACYGIHECTGTWR